MTTRTRRRWPYVLGALLLLLVVAGAILVNRLDSILLSKTREQTQALSAQWGRPVTVADVSTTLFPRIGAEVEGVEIGAAPGEDLPLVRIERIDVAAAAWAAIKSRGKDIQVHNAEVGGLTVNLIRFPDGTTNLSRFQEKLAEQQKQEEPKPEDEAPTDLSGVRVDRAALVDGKVRLIDRSTAQEKELAIHDIDVEVKDLRVGEPLEVVLKAGVLDPKQNVEARLNAAPLPPTLVPTPQKLTLKIAPIDIGPLGPFLGPEAGLQAGRVEGDWTAELGAAVPGGTGPTRLVGLLKATGLKFAGAEGGKLLDVVLDTDVKGDVAAGDLALDKLNLAFGPARIKGQGRVKGLAGATPSVEGLELVGENLDPAVLAQYYPPLKKQLPGDVAGPIGLRVSGSGDAGKQNVALALDFTPVRLGLPEQLKKAAGAPMKLTATLAGSGANDGALRFDANADLLGVDMRPGGSLNKAPGQPMTVDATGTFRAATEKSPMRVDVSKLVIRLLDDTMTGTATYVSAGTPKKPRQEYSLNLSAERLDADKLLLTEEQAAALGIKIPPPESLDPNRFAGMVGDIQFTAKSLRYAAMDLTGLTTRVKMQEDTMTVESLRAGLYGGTVSADGTTMRLGPARRPFAVKAKVENMDLAKASEAQFEKKNALAGTFTGDIDLAGEGFEKEDLAKALAGAVAGNAQNLQLLGVDVFDAAAGLLAKALPFASKKLEAGGVTSFGELLPFSVTIANGAAQLSKPITSTRPQGQLRLEGGVKLDGTLDLGGVVELAPATVKTLTLGKANLEKPVPVNIKVTGPLWKPVVSGVDLAPAAKMVAAAAGAAALDKLVGDRLGERGEKLKEVVAGGPEAAEAAARAEAAKKRAELEARAAEERRKAEEAARAEQEKAKAKAAEEAKKRLKGVFGG